MRRSRIVVPLLSGLALTVAAAPASAAESASTSSIRLSGGQNTAGPLCGATQNFIQAGVGANAQAVIRAAKTKKGRTGRKGTKVVVERCANGGWNGVSSSKLGVRKKAKRVGLATALGNTGDYRIRIVTSKNKPKGRSVYVRVGAGEIVDTPVTFTVKNQNRTVVPCLNSPDNGIYQVKGSIVTPRSVLTGGGSSGRGADMTLYYHGLGYGAFFWRFQAVPGYDYGAQQALAGHASVVVDRLGYGASKGPADGNKICYSSQADIADQIISALRTGNYTTGEGRGFKAARVALVGHSAGSLIAGQTQGTFRSADALGLTGFNNTSPTPLAFSQLSATSIQCGADPVAGPNGAKNYGRFGNTDADFTAGHFFNIDPVVAAKALQMRSPDPCGDIFSVPGSFVAEQGYSRTIDVALLLAQGTNDALFLPAGQTVQLSPFGSPFKSNSGTKVENIPQTGHALTLGRTHLVFQNAMHRWLASNGF